jgi:DNA-binding CsgD family transcriptional regulator
METQMNRRCLDILHASSVSEFKRLNVEFIHSLGFQTISATVVTDHSSSLTDFQSVTNAPVDYMPCFEDMDSARLDPVSQHCKRSSSPIVWDQDFYVGEGRGDYWEEQAAFGYKSGICVAFHLPRGRHFMYGVDSPKRSCGSKKDARSLSTDVQEFAAYAQAAAFDLCMPYSRTETRGELAIGELDALRRSMDGLNNWEVGRAMAISDTEVMLRLRRAMHKLGCANKYETALRAIRLGLVDCD